ncbi:MAG: hypothetical protein JWR21_4137 [Herminiimonas sp.]|nr:hypothetical protein [Herminiimonas sp.]
MTTISTPQDRAGRQTRASAAVILVCAMLAACGSVPPAPVPLGEKAVPPAGTPPATSVAIPVVSDPGGPIRLSAASVWLPSASGFGPTAKSQQRDGRLVLTDSSVSWQFRSAGGMYQTAHRVAFADIRSVALAESGVDRLIVLQRQDFGYDTFGLMRPDEKAMDPLATVQAYRTLLDLLHLPAPAQSGDKAF